MKALLFKDWGAKCFYLAVAGLGWIMVMLFSLVRGGLNLDCYWSGKQEAVCKNKTGRSRAQMTWEAPDMLPAHTNHCTLSPEDLHCHGQLVTQAISVTSRKAMAEPQLFHL